MKKGLYLVLFAGMFLLYGCSVSDLKATDSNAAKTVGSETKDGSLKGSTNEKDLSPDSDKLKKNIDGSEIDKKTVSTESTSIIAYYQDTDGLLIPITRKILKQEGIARAAIQSLIDNTANREELSSYGVLPVLPNGTEIKGITIKDSTAVIDFNESLLSYNDYEAEKKIISSIVYTLTEFISVENVKILINGHEQKKLKFGVDLSGALKRDNILINSNKVNLSNGMIKLNIFYVKSLNNQSICVLPVSKEFNVVKTEQLPEKIIKYLSDKTDEDKFFTEVPDGTQLISSKIDGDLLILNFNKRFAEYGGNTREEGIIKQLLHSMKQIKGIKKVKILIDGKTENLPEGTDISKDFEVPKEINTILAQ